MLEQLLGKIRMLQTADPPMAAALEAVVRETLKRLDDRLDISEFIPTEPAPPPPPPVPPPPPPPQTRINIDLQGQLPPGDAEKVLAADAGMQAQNAPPPPGAGPPGAPPGPPGAPPTLPGGHPMPSLPGGVPMPPLTAKPAPGALKPGPAAPGASTPK